MSLDFAFLGSPTKTRTTSAGSPGRGTKGSKARLGNEVEIQPDVDDQDVMDTEEEYDFLGYDVGDDLIHVTGVQSSMFPCDGGEIRVEKTQYVRGPSSVSSSVHKDGNILKLHFLEPLEEILVVQPRNISVGSKEESVESREKTEDDVTGDEPSDEGVEKSEFEANEKTASFHEDATRENEEMPSEQAVFCTHASFVAELNDGMVITCSGFGAHGKPRKQEERLDGEPAAGKMNVNSRVIPAIASGQQIVVTRVMYFVSTTGQAEKLSECVGNQTRDFGC